MRKYLLLILGFFIFTAQAIAAPKLLSAKMIWDQSPYNSVTDLIYFQNQFLCCFRESDSHQGGKNGTIRILASPDA